MEEKQQESSCTLQRNGRRRRVILFPLPYQGHINPMFRLASILYSKGFSITIIHTDLNSPNSRNYPHYEFHSISSGLSKAEFSTSYSSDVIVSLNEKCILPFRDCLAKLTNNQEDSFACLIADPIWYFLHANVNDFKLPTIVLQTNSVAACLAFVAYPIFWEKGYLPIQDSKLEELVIELPPLRVKDIPVFSTKDPTTVDKVILAMDSQIKASSGIIWNTCQELEQVELTKMNNQCFSIPMFPIGPFHRYLPAAPSSNLLSSQDQSIISWLDKHAPNSVIYVSLGTVAVVDESILLEMAWGLANSKMPFLWVIRKGLVREAEWSPELLPKGYMEMIDGRGQIVKWAPQKEVLAHSSVGGFLTHNGWNSTLESISEGVPMICHPCFGDQMVNARYVSDVWKVGLHLEGKLERMEIESAIKRLMVETEGQEIRERILCLKKKVNLSLQQGGSSYQSLERLIANILTF